FQDCLRETALRESIRAPLFCCVLPLSFGAPETRRSVAPSRQPTVGGRATNRPHPFHLRLGLKYCRDDPEVDIIALFGRVLEGPSFLLASRAPRRRSPARRRLADCQISWSLSAPRPLLFESASGMCGFWGARRLTMMPG